MATGPSEEEELSLLSPSEAARWLDACRAIRPFSEDDLSLLSYWLQPPAPAEPDVVAAAGGVDADRSFGFAQTVEGTSPFDTSGVPPPQPPAAESDFDTIMVNDQGLGENLGSCCSSVAPSVPAEPADFHATMAIGPLSEKELSRWYPPVGPGFRFDPTDEELVRYYLKHKVTGKSLKFEPIAVVDIYKFKPWDLPSKSKLNTGYLEWYFFTVLDNKNASGSKTKRSIGKGYWKTTGKDQAVKHAERDFGLKKTLVYYEGRERTKWVMHEYRIVDEQVLAQAGTRQTEHRLVVCRIFKKSGTGPKNGQYGAPFTAIVCDSPTLGPGFRFHPTDEELVWYYLNGKVTGKSFKFEPITVIDIYKFEPWDLPSKSKLNTRDLVWYFFTVLDKKNGSVFKTHRSTKKGRWKATGENRDIKHAEHVFGMKKTLVYYEGGKRSNWVMHEYMIVDEQVLAQAGTCQEYPLVVCKIFKKSGTGPRNGEQYGAPLIEEEWDDDGEAVPVPFAANEPLVAVSAGEAGAFVETGNLAQLHSAPESSNGAHVIACMVSITNITVTGNAKDWMMGKNGGFNTIIATGFSHSVVASAMPPVSGLLTSKTAFVLSHSWIFLILFSVLILSISFKIGS